MFGNDPTVITTISILANNSPKNFFTIHLPILSLKVQPFLYFISVLDYSTIA